MKSNSTIIIGPFLINVTAYDNLSKVYEVIFFLDNSEFAVDNYKPYTIYCDQQHWGKTTLKAEAWDYCGNVASDTLDIYYYNPF